MNLEFLIERRNLSFLYYFVEFIIQFFMIRSGSHLEYEHKGKSLTRFECNMTKQNDMMHIISNILNCYDER